MKFNEEFDWCKDEDMLAEWKKGIKVDHNYLRESVRKGNPKLKEYRCARCGVDVLGS